MGFLCPCCQKEFTQKVNLRTHIESVHEKKRHKCDQCEKDFAGESGLRYHKLTKHEGKKININKKQCPHCKKSFKTGGDYNQHLLTHQSLKPFLCPFCSSYAAKMLVHLKRHIDSVHFKCRWFCLMDGCNSSATNGGDLNQHFKKKHNISRNFVNHMEQRRTAATPSSLTPVRGKLPSSTTNNNDPREASTSLRQQSTHQSFTVKHEDINNETKLRSLLNRLGLIANSTSSDSSSSDNDSSDESSDQSDASNEKSDETQDQSSKDDKAKASSTSDQLQKRRRLVWHNSDATSSSDDDVDHNDDKQSNSKSSSSSSSSSKQEKNEESASSSSSGPPPRRIDVEPRKIMWLPTGEQSKRGFSATQTQNTNRGAPELCEYEKWIRDRDRENDGEESDIEIELV